MSVCLILCHSLSGSHNGTADGEIPLHLIAVNDSNGHNLLTVGDIIDAIQVAGANLVKHVLSPSSLDFQGLIPIEQLTSFAAGEEK